MKVARCFIPTVQPIGNANIKPRYSIERAAWIWDTPDVEPGPAVVRFTCDISLDAPTSTTVHVSADERYELFIDGSFVSAGPHRSDPMHWAFSSYQVQLEAGKHHLEAIVWKLGELAPHAQMSVGAGFILAADGLESQLNTGLAPWRAQRIGGYRFSKVPMYRYHVIGPAEHVDGAAPDDAACDTIIIAPPIPDGRTGVVQPRWRLTPSPLPDMMRQPITPGSFRAIRQTQPANTPWHNENSKDCVPWNALLRKGETVTVEPNCDVQLIWDLGDYYCGYPTLHVDGGSGATISWEWAESLYEPADDTPSLLHKNQRNAVARKVFHGFGDSYKPNGNDNQSWQPLWWRCGRFVQLTLHVGDEALRITHLGIDETRYPRDSDCTFTCDDRDLEAIIPIAQRGIAMCSHETLMDCPYYEQLMYVGDSRLQLLVAYMMSGDDRLTRRAIELLDWSRWNSGFINERYPSNPLQQSLTFSMLWIAMVHDYAMWRDDLPWVTDRLPAVRSVMDNLLQLRGDDGLLHKLPGWSFVDWVGGWQDGNPPGAIEGDSSIVNLHLLTALRSAAALEEACGNRHMMARFTETADALGSRIIKTYWNEDAACIADTSAHDTYSEHAQCLALLNNLLSTAQAERCFAQLTSRDDLTRTTVYFSHYLLETLHRFGNGDALLNRMASWKEQVRLDFKTPAEMPEPSRSDCHAWGSHPLYHMIASLAGVRPASPGFRSVRIAPTPGSLQNLSATLPHPRGEIAVSISRDMVDITLPAGVDGVFHWRGKDHTLAEGRQAIRL